MIFHVSEEAGIERFEPRAPEGGGEPVVWAVDAARLRNYLVPRDCPRVTYYAGAGTTPEDVERFLGSSAAVVAVESVWLERPRRCRLCCYHLPPATFECVDECAGYFVSRAAVVPARAEVFEDPLGGLLARGAELRFAPELWTLHDAVAASSLRFSLIRMRDARPRAREAGGVIR